jgi:hypothetical protein
MRRRGCVPRSRRKKNRSSGRREEHGEPLAARHVRLGHFHPTVADDDPITRVCLSEMAAADVARLPAPQARRIARARPAESRYVLSASAASRIAGSRRRAHSAFVR